MTVLKEENHMNAKVRIITGKTLNLFAIYNVQVRQDYYFSNPFYVTITKLIKGAKVWGYIKKRF